MKEIRIGVVLFGGVSLAVYMNGITTELWHLLRASPRPGKGNGAQPPVLDGNAAVWAELLHRLAETAGGELRVVVDAVAGSSAGGLNGVALAKAVVEGGNVEPLEDCWIEEADIARLLPAEWRRPSLLQRLAFGWLAGRVEVLGALRQRLSGRDKALWDRLCAAGLAYLKAPDGAAAVLEGGSFTRMIAKALRRMNETSLGPSLMQRQGSFDLFLTRTDLAGWPRHLAVSERYHPEPLYERRHAHVMHFRKAFRNGPFQQDFALTYAGRSTAGFPFAFQPLDYETAAADFRAARPEDPLPAADEFRRRYLREQELFQVPLERSLMIDGGVLDNKPFTYVAAAIERKPADCEVHRVVVYVEPDPAPQGEEEAAGATLSGKLDFAKQLFRLFRHEPIHGDLVRLQERNARVRDIRRLLEANRRSAEASAEAAGRAWAPALAWPPQAAEADAWRQATNAFAAGKTLSGFPGYVAAKAVGAGRLLADTVCHILEFPYHARHAFMVRRVVLAWLEAQEGFLEVPRPQPCRGHVLSARQLSLLEAFDIPYRLRRLRALVGQVNALYRTPPPAGAAFADLDAFKAALADSVVTLELATEKVHCLRDGLLEALGDGLLLRDVEAAVARNDFRPDRVAVERGAALQRAYGYLAAHFQAIGRDQNQALATALGRLPEPWVEPVMKTLVTFPFLDFHAYPLMQAADVEDLIEVEVMRISPDDVPAGTGGRGALKCLGFGAFEGFLDREARVHDVVSGRLHGAHRLMDLLLDAAFGEEREGAEARALRDRFLPRLEQGILETSGRK